MTQQIDPVKLLALAVYQLGGELEISNQLLDDMLPVRLVWDQQTNPDRIRLTIMSNEMLIGTVDNDSAHVVEFTHQQEAAKEVVLTSDE